MLTMDRIDAIRKAREWTLALPSQIPQQIPNYDSRPPRYSAEDLLYLVDPDVRKPFDMGEVILRLVDDSRFSSFKPGFGTSLMTGFAQIFGKSQKPVTVEELSSDGVYRIQCWHNRQQDPCYPRR
jgi:acetyl-CoA carboxylase carboxyltransferase component